MNASQAHSIPEAAAMTLGEIEHLHSDEWVLVGEIEVLGAGMARGVVLAHSDDLACLREAGEPLRRGAILWAADITRWSVAEPAPQTAFDRRQRPVLVYGPIHCLVGELRRALTR